MTADSIRLISLLSGTSADGVDAGLVLIEGRGADTRLTLEWFETLPFPSGMRERILKAPFANGFEIARLDARLGDLFGEAAETVHRVATSRNLAVDAVASHGQTLCHMPEKDGEDPPASLQIGQADRIVQRVGLTTVSDFRQRDLAAGGQGAPLVPYLDHVLFGFPGKVRLPVNLGGIMNLSVITGDLSEVMAFDVGPANCISDELVRHETGGGEGYDESGVRASRGDADPEVVSWILDRPFFSQLPPRSAGREDFGAPFVAALRDRFGDRLSLEDLLASTALALGKSLRLAIDRFVVPSFKRCDEVILSGGGVQNKALIQALLEEVSPIPVVTSQEYGVSPDGKECLLFALLARETLRGVPSNVPSASGARELVIQGKISYPLGSSSRLAPSGE